MKIRTSFVSNSSSSSFTAFMPLRIHEKVIEQLSETHRDAIVFLNETYKKNSIFQTKIMDTVPMLSFHAFFGNAAGYKLPKEVKTAFNAKYPDKDLDEEVHDATHSYRTILQKQFPDDHLSLGFDF